MLYISFISTNNNVEVSVHTKTFFFKTSTVSNKDR